MDGPTDAPTNGHTLLSRCKGRIIKSQSVEKCTVGGCGSRMKDVGSGGARIGSGCDSDGIGGMVMEITGCW